MLPPHCYAGGHLGGGGGCYIGHVPQDPVAYNKATWAALRRTQDVFDLPLLNGICIRQLQETAHVITMHMPLTPQMPECFFPSAAAANVPHDVVHNKFMALMHCICRREFSADGLHRRLHMSPTCPFRRMVCRGVYTHLSYLSFLADGLLGRLHNFPTCPFRRMVYTGHYASL